MGLTHTAARDKDRQPQNIDQTNTRRKMMPRQEGQEAIKAISLDYSFFRCQ